MNYPINQPLIPLPVIHPLSLESIGLASGALVSAPSSLAYSAANRAFYIPFHVEVPILVTLLFALNGATASGNIDVGIYGPSFARIVSAGSTAQAGTDTVQTFDIADTLLGPGDFYFGVAMDNATGTLYRVTDNGGSAGCQRCGILMQSSAFPLPATATPVSTTANYIPMIGLRQGGTAI